jgi:glycosyltransferase involved in cell wall biosynthesis
MTPGTPRLALTSTAGDPRAERTWSGTPFNLTRELEALGVTVVAIDSSLTRPLKMLALLAHKARGLGRDYKRGPAARYLAGRIVRRRCQEAGVSRVLHTGTFDLPVPGPARDFESYLLCDSVWNETSGYGLFTHSARSAETASEQDPMPGRRSVGYSARALRLYSELERRSYSQIKHFFPEGEYVKKALVADYGIKEDAITVVGTGRGKIAPFSGSKDYARGPILFVAKERFEDKGGLLLVKAFQIAVRKSPDLKLVMAGRAVPPGCGGEVPNITVAGHVPWDDLQRLFETASLFAMPALWEPWGLVYLEALACKTPLLGLARNSLPELTQNGRFGFLVSQPDPEAIAAAILDAHSDPKRLERMGAEGQAYCLANFSWAKVVAKIYRQVFGADGPRAGTEA